MSHMTKFGLCPKSKTNGLQTQQKFSYTLCSTCPPCHNNITSKDDFLFKQALWLCVQCWLVNRTFSSPTVLTEMLLPIWWRYCVDIYSGVCINTTSFSWLLICLIAYPALIGSIRRRRRRLKLYGSRYCNTTNYRVVKLVASCKKYRLTSFMLTEPKTDNMTTQIFYILCKSCFINIADLILDAASISSISQNRNKVSKESLADRTQRHRQTSSDECVIVVVCARRCCQDLSLLTS